MISLGKSKKEWNIIKKVLREELKGQNRYFKLKGIYMSRKKIEIKSKTKTSKGEYNKAEVLGVLNFVKIGVEQRGSLTEEFSHLFFDGEFVFSFNDKMCVLCPLAFPINGSIVADKFVNLLSKVEQETFNVAVSEGEIVVEAGLFSFGLAYVPPGEYHNVVKEIGVVNIKEWKEMSQELRDVIVHSSYCSSRDITRPDLLSVFVSGKDVLATDRFRVNWFELSKPIEGELVVPVSVGSQLNNYNVTHYHVDANWVHFKGEDFYISCRLVGAKFPEKQCKEFFETVIGDTFELPGELSKVVQRAMIIESDVIDLDKKVTVKIEEDRIVCRSVSEGVGWFNEVVLLNKKISEKEQISFVINPVFFVEVLRRTNKISFVGENAFLFVGDNFRHIMSAV